MRFVNASGLWTTGPEVPEPPAVAVLEVSGAVLEWPIGNPAAARDPRIAMTKVEAAEWLWRVFGERAHVAIVTALQDRALVPDGVVDVPTGPARAERRGITGPGRAERRGITGPGRAERRGIAEPSVDALAILHRLAVGHWLRRWWPASDRDGIAGLDPALLDGELALLTLQAQDYFTDDTLDSDVEGLLSPHRAALAALRHDADERVAELATACGELADEFGVPEAVSTVVARGRRDDYALAAGPGRTRASHAPIASGTASVNWIAVPPGVFDAADGTVEWSVAVAGGAAVGLVSVGLSTVATRAPATGIEVRLRSGAVQGAGVLDATGTATLPLFGAADRPLTEAQAWAHDWSDAAAAVGADVAVSADAESTRRSVREYARARLAEPGDGAFLAELLAAESDY